jgi:hypothetical protein
MRRPLGLPLLLAALGAATACDVDPATAPPAPPAAVTPPAGVSAALATLLGTTTVDEPGRVGYFTSLVSSSDGWQRVAYYDVTNHRLKYAACASNCTVASNWQRGVVDQSAEVGLYASLKVRSGVRHVVYYDATNGNLKYARCDADCFLQGSWAKATIASSGDVGRGAALAINAQTGRLYVSYVNVIHSMNPIGTLKYATCLSACTTAANWERATVDGTLDGTFDGAVSGVPTSIAVDAGGRRHVSYVRFEAELDGAGHLTYATCLASCTDPANWERVTVDASARGERNSLAVDGAGVRHISYHEPLTLDLKYARCASNCGNAAGWGRVTVDGVSSLVGDDNSLAVGSDGRVHVSYYDKSNHRLRYASCGGNCLQAASWSRQTVDGGCSVFLVCTDAGQYTSLKLGGGKVHVSYYRATGQNLKYAELTP